MAKGIIKRLVSSRRSGFIRTVTRGDVFFDFNELQGLEFSSLKEGQQVQHEVGQDSQGRLLAMRVRPV
jgi:cold shock CspA family protein